MIQIGDRYQPDLELSQRYDRLFEIYHQVYGNLIQEFSAIADYQRYSHVRGHASA